MGLHSALQRCGCGRRRGIGDQGNFDTNGAAQNGASQHEAKAQQETRKSIPPEEDPLMGAKSAADAETAMELREQGNACFKEEKYEEALDFYNDALLLQRHCPALWLNRSIVNRQLQNWEDALEDAEVVIEMRLPSSKDTCKAYYSKALCQQALGKLLGAKAVCSVGLRVDPENKALLQLRSVLKRQIAEKSQEEAQLDAKQRQKESRERERRAEKPQPQMEDSAAGPSRRQAEPRAKPAKHLRTLEPEPKQQAAEAVGLGAASPDACPLAQLPQQDIEDIKAKADSTIYKWKGKKPSMGQREGLKKMMTDMFREKYHELSSDRSTLPTDQYDKEQKMGLKLEGGHRFMKRPDGVDLPAAYKDHMGIMSVKELGKYNFENPQQRIMISVYGNVFDVSDRPDKYGTDGPYTVLTGVDITWGLFAGVDSEEYTNRFYDLFKAKDLGVDKMAGVLSWLAWYWTEYGDPVATLEPYIQEEQLPVPPVEEVEACCMM